VVEEIQQNDSEKSYFLINSVHHQKRKRIVDANHHIKPKDSLKENSFVEKVYWSELYNDWELSFILLLANYNDSDFKFWIIIKFGNSTKELEFGFSHSEDRGDLIPPDFLLFELGFEYFCRVREFLILF
jgi:hypothetical protein